MDVTWLRQGAFMKVNCFALECMPNTAYMQYRLNLESETLLNIQRYTPITVYETAPFQTRKI